MKIRVFSGDNCSKDRDVMSNLGMNECSDSGRVYDSHDADFRRDVCSDDYIASGYSETSSNTMRAVLEDIHRDIEALETVGFDDFGIVLPEFDSPEFTRMFQDAGELIEDLEDILIKY